MSVRMFDVALWRRFHYPRFGIAGNIFPPVKKQHPRRIRLINLNAAIGRQAFGMIEARCHMQQVPQRNLPPIIISPVPFGDRCRLVERQPPVRHHQAN